MTDQNNLIPPHHFEPDSLDGSPLSNRLKSPRSILKTPNDFFIPAETKAYRSAGNSPCVAPQISKPHRTKLKSTLSRRSHSASRYTDSGYDWADSRVAESDDDTTDTDEAAYNVIMGLKKENKVMKAMLCKSKLGQEQGRQDADIVNQQVKFIDRLQRDLCLASQRLSDTEHELKQSNTERQQIKLENKELNALIKNYEDRLQSQSKIEDGLLDDISSLKQSIISEKNFQESIKEKFDHDLDSTRLEHISNIEKLHLNHMKEIEDIKRNFESKENKLQKENEELVNFWEQKLKHEVDRNRSELSNSVEKITQEKDNMMCKHEQLKCRILNLEDVNHSLNQSLNEMENKVKSSELKNESLLQEIASANDQLVNEKTNSSNLKSYITQIQADDHAKSQWKNEKRLIENNVKDLESDKLELIKSLEVLNVRFESISRIVELQEEAVTANSKAIPNSTFENKVGVVTSQWRGKVFELMVQNKSLDILLREESSKHEIINNNLQLRLEDSNRQVNILSNQLRNLEAQLQLNEHRSLALTNKNIELTSNSHLLEEQISQQDKSILELVANVKILKDQLQTSYSKNLTKIMEKCLSIDQRLSFASNRVRTVRDLFLRKEAKWRACVDKKTTKTVEDTSKNVDLNFEIDRLNEEREMLSQQLLEDAKSFEHHMIESKSSDASKNLEIKELRRELLKKEETIKQLEVKIDDLNHILEEEKGDNKILKDKVNLLKITNQTNIDDAAENLKMLHLDKIKAKECEISKMKRELTKSVVTMRQQERLATREKNRSTEQLELERTAWLDEEKKLKSEIRNLQRDNNLMITTLRQEGLISGYNEARSKPIHPTFLSDKTNIESSSDNRRQPCEDKPIKLVQFADDLNKNEEGVDKMLQNLTNLSNKILTEDSD